MKSLLNQSTVKDPCKRPYFFRDEKLLPDRVWLDVWIIPANEDHNIGGVYSGVFGLIEPHYIMQGYYLLCGKKGMGTVFFGVN